ncbi:alpha/beta hydrolase, partial [Nocardia gipuzkoensis]
YLRQQQRYAEYLSTQSIPVISHTVPDRDHFDLPLDLADPSTPFGRISLNHMGSEGTVTSAR